MRVGAALASARAAGLDRADAEILLAACSGRSRTQLFAYPEFELDATTQARFLQWVSQRRNGMPVAYLLGTQEFYGLRLAVGPDVLVPRPETELLVEFALGRGDSDIRHSVLDLGTGSGAIALAIAWSRPHWRVFATDRSVAALTLAQRNATTLGLERIEWASGNWLQAVPGLVVDCIVSNPPYLAADDPHLPTLQHEPRSALVAGADALEDLHTLVADAIGHLRPGGWLALEHGWTQARDVREALQLQGYVEVGSQRDLAGHERISFGRRPGDSRASPVV